MFQWLVQFFSSLPGLHWVVFYAVLTYGGLRLWTGELSGRIKLPSRDKGMAIFFGALLNVIALGGSLLALSGIEKETGGPRIWDGYPKSIVFQMMAVGAAVFVLRTVADWLWPRVPKWAKAAWGWAQATRRAWHQRRDRDPERILTECRVRLAQAKKERSRIDGSILATDYTGVIGFDQAGDGLLKFLEKLFSLVAHIDAWFACFEQDGRDRERADAIYPDVPLEQFRSLLGTGTVDTAAMKRLRECAQGLIENTVRVFQRLPGEVLRERVLRQASQIEGLQAEMAKIDPRPETSSTTGLIADLETGRLQERFLEQLAASAARPATPAVQDPESPKPAVPVRAKARA